MEKYYSLAGQNAVVTGGASGLGLAITRCLIGAGAKVAVLGRSAEAHAADTLAEFGDRAAYYRFDITETDKAQAIADRITAEQGPVSILVNNAGNHCKKFIWEMSVEEYVSVLNVHLVGAFALTKAFVPQMKERRHGRIIFQASMTSYIGQPQVAGYSSAKAGYLGLIHTLTAELAEYGITVNAIAPGFIETEMTENLDKGEVEKLIPLKRMGKASDIAKAVLFLLSADYITGSVLKVDGGIAL